MPNCDECPANLWTVNFEAFEIYGKLLTQMKYGPDGTPIGLDYSAIGFIFDIHGVVDLEKRRKLFDKITLIEREFLPKGGGK